MKTMKSILRFSLILYLCVLLTGASYILTASAKITPHPDMDGTDLITIVKGDTLWDLAAKHLENSRAWPEFKQYNTFSDPNRIYPGEMMRIPVEMVEEIIEEVIETVPLSDLEKVRMELEAMAARAMAAEEAVGVTAADVTAIKKMLDDVVAQQKKVKSGLKDLKSEVTEGQANAISEINGALMDHAKASKMAIAEVKEEVDEVEEDIKELRQTVKDKAKAGMEASKASEEKLAAAIQANADSLDKLHKMHRGATEKPNKSKRTIAFLTTLAGTAAWFAISSMD